MDDGAKVLEFIEEALDEIASQYSAKSQVRGVLRLAFGGITGVISRWASVSSSGSASYALSPGIANFARC
jgi:hypothetical protein